MCYVERMKGAKSMNKYEERRAEALKDMGLELEDIRNGERFRLAMLQGVNGTGGSPSGGANYKAYDAVIDFDADGSAFTFNIIKGSYAEIVALLSNEVPPNILVRSWVKNNNSLLNAKTSSSAVLLYSNNSESSEPYVAFTFYVAPNPNAGAMFFWHADDTVTPV